LLAGGGVVADDILKIKFKIKIIINHKNRSSSVFLIIMAFCWQ
jgi:hypothetical protein